MKKFFTTVFCLLLFYLSFSQDNTKEYKDLISKSRPFYLAKDYKNAAILYSAAVRAGGTLATNNDRWTVACYWMAANLPDSAYLQLNDIATSADLNFDYIIDLLTDDDCFLTLHNDKRWKDLKNKMFDISRNKFYTVLKTADKKTAISERYRAGLAFLLINDYDSAFYYLNVVAESDDLTFENVYGMVSNSLLTYLEKDKRWNELKSRMFISLNKKYIPASTFSNTIKSPKRLLIDGGHYNLHEISGTYATLAGTLRKSGFEVSGLEGKFTETSLKNSDMLIISNPYPDREDSLVQRARRANEPVRWSAAFTQSAFTESEVMIIKSWVQNGGSLLLILDHAPYGKTGGLLTAAFGIENRNVGTYDPLSRDPAVDSNQAKTILFTRSKKLIGKHPIVDGVDSITTYTGESLIGPPGSDVLLHLPATATDLDWVPETKEYRNRSAAGRSQGVAFEYGKGRIVMLGEAAVTRPSSLSVNDRGNWKFILNILRWMAREKMD